METENNNAGPSKVDEKRLRSISIFTYLCGLSGLSLSITCTVWVFLSLSLEPLLPPLLSRRTTVLTFVSVFLLASFCSVSAWISGVIASRLARNLGRRGYRRWRLGLYMGIFGTMLLMTTFVVLSSYSIHVLMYRYEFTFNNRML